MLGHRQSLRRPAFHEQLPGPSRDEQVTGPRAGRRAALTMGAIEPHSASPRSIRTRPARPAWSQL
jgi:hypothetical protein